jgi:peptidoglycan/LPS O-acetylase OafA/YrhL
MIDLLKVVAAQVILWHHFCRYGPVARTIEAAGHDWVAFIGNHGRHAVQVFLVISGFLAARSIRTFLTSSSLTELAVAVGQSWLSRVSRLGKPYWLMLLVAILFSSLARQIQPDIDTPASPQWRQALTHFLFLQDMFSMDALSTGVWYVAIDLQFSLLFLCLLLACGAVTAKTGQLNSAKAERALELIVGLLMLMALFGFNRWRSLDIWAIYFFGSFGIGLTIGFRSIQARKKTVLFWIALISSFAVALASEWRPGLLVALICAALLSWSSTHSMATLNRKPLLQGWLSRLSRDSYALFLFHYPVVMLVGTIVNQYWQGQVLPAMLGLLGSWAIAMLIAFGVTRSLTTQKPLQKPIQNFAASTI